jgi:hypothetical protein
MMVRMMLILLLGLKIFTFEVPLAENRYRSILKFGVATMTTSEY